MSTWPFFPVWEARSYDLTTHIQFKLTIIFVFLNNGYASEQWNAKKFEINPNIIDKSQQAKSSVYAWRT